MKKQLLKTGILLAFIVLGIQNVHSQIEKKFDIILHSEYKNQKSDLNLSSIVYTIGSAPIAAGAKPLDNFDRIYISLSGSVPLNKELIKMFENKTQSINGFIEVKDPLGKMPTRKFEFQNATYVLTESISTLAYDDASNFSINIFVDNFTIDGVAIFK